LLIAAVEAEKRSGQGGIDMAFTQTMAAEDHPGYLLTDEGNPEMFRKRPFSPALVETW
jgi:hypothetical protein